MKLEYLYAYNAVYEEKTIFQAAEKLDLSDKTVQKYLNNIEDEIGIKLTIRGSRGIDFTEEGKNFYLYSSNVVSSLDAYKNNLSKKQTEYIIAAERRTFFTCAISASEKVMEKFDVIFSFKELYREEIFNGLVDRKYDLGVIIMDKGLFSSLDNYNLEFVAMTTRNTVAIVDITHPLASKDEISLTELRNYKRLVFENPFDEYYNYYYNIDKKYNLTHSNIILKYIGDISLVIQNSTSYYLGGICEYEEKNLIGLKCIRIKEIKDPIEVGYVHSKDFVIDEVLQNLIYTVNRFLKTI